MPRESKETVIDGVTYRVTQFGGVKSYEVMARMGLGLAAKEMSPGDLMWLRGEFAACTKVGVVDEKGDGKVRFVDLSGIYDDHFAGGPKAHAAMMQWLKFAAEANFGPFGDVLPAIVRGLKDLLPSASRPTPPGGSGGSSPASG